MYSVTKPRFGGVLLYNFGVSNLIYLVIFIFGAAVGSFVNVVALRYGSGLPFTRGRSVCFSCGKELAWHELIPVFSYIILRGRCSVCHSKFSIQYFLVEIISGLAFVYLYLEFRISNFEFWLLAIIYCLLSIIFIYDLRHKIIPDSFVLLFILFSLAFSIIHNSYPIIHILLAAFLIPLPFALIWLFSKGRLMGLGDAKFMVGMGFLLGMQAVSAVFLSFWIGGAFVLILYAYKLFCQKIFKKSYNIGMKSEIPFAPFLVLGTVLTFFFNINLLTF